MYLHLAPNTFFPLISEAGGKCESALKPPGSGTIARLRSAFKARARSQTHSRTSSIPPCDRNSPPLSMRETTRRRMWGLNETPHRPHFPPTGRGVALCPRTLSSPSPSPRFIRLLVNERSRRKPRLDLLFRNLYFVRRTEFFHVRLQASLVGQELLAF